MTASAHAFKLNNINTVVLTVVHTVIRTVGYPV